MRGGSLRDRARVRNGARARGRQWPLLAAVVGRGHDRNTGARSKGFDNIHGRRRLKIDGEGDYGWRLQRMNSLSFTVADGVATLVIHRAAVSNAIDITIIRAMHSGARSNPKGRQRGAKAVVITGSNDVFCSGLDLHSVDLKTQEARQRAHFEMRRFMDPSDSAI
jgi:hypothetical protein